MSHSPSPLHMAKTLIRQRFLLKQMTIRDIGSKYRGSALGLVWSILTPLCLLAVYTLVFTVVFKARWAGTPLAGSSDTWSFALFVFIGLITFNVFSECLSRSPTILLGNVNLIKKVVFPVEIFPLIIVGSALFHYVINFTIFLLALMAVGVTPTATVFLVPVIILPYLLFICGISWFLASLGVFLRDIGQLMQLCITVLMFLSPIFYPIEVLPEQFQSFLYLNPATYIIEELRAVSLLNQGIRLPFYMIYLGASLVCFMLGFAWFQKTRHSFADVI